MRHLSRKTLVVCVAVLLFALPVQASKTLKRAKMDARSSSQVSATWLESLWSAVTHLLPGTSQAGRSGKKPVTRPNQIFGTTANGGSCIDPDGCPY